MNKVMNRAADIAVILWHDADCYGITIEVYTADRYGRNIEYLDLFPAFCHTMEEPR